MTASPSLGHELAALRASRDLLSTLSATRTPADTARAVMDAACRVEGVDSGGVYLVDRQSGGLQLIGHRGLPPWFIEQATVFPADAPETALVQTGKSHYFDEGALTAQDQFPAGPMCRGAGLRAVAILPVRLGGEVVAALFLASHTHPEIPPPARDILEVMTAPLGGAFARTQMEETLHPEHDFAEQLIHTARVIIVVLDLEGRIVRFNPYLEALSGHRLADVQGRDWCTTFLPERDRDAVRAIVRNMPADTPILFHVNSIRTRDGLERLIEWHNTALKDAEGQPTAILAVGLDITERNVAEAALYRRTQQLEAVRTIGAEVTRELDLTRLLALIHRRAADLLGARSGFLLLYDEPTQTLIPRSWEGHGHWVGGLRFRLGEGISGTVAARRRGMVVNDYRTSPHIMSQILDHTSVASVVAEPLLFRDRLVGVVTVDNQGAEERTFTEEDREILALFAVHAAIAIENARAHEAALRRGEELEALLRASRTVTAGLDLQATLEQIVAEASRIARCPHVKLVLVDGEKQQLHLGVVHGMPAPPIFPMRIGYAFSGTVAQTGQPLFVPECQTDPRNPHAAADRHLGFRTYLGLPVKTGEQILGVLTFNTTEPRTYSDADLAYLTSFADQAAIALENARLHSAALRRSAELEAILQANRAIQSSVDLPSRLQEIVQQAATIAGAAAARILLLEPDAQVLRGTVGVGLPPEGAGEYVIPVGESFSGHVAATGEPLVVADTRSDPRLRWREHVTRYGLVSYLGLPVTFQGTLLGVLVINTTAPRTYAPEEVALLSLFASQAAIAIQNARQYQDEQHRRQELEAVRAVSQELVRELDLGVLLRLIHARAIELVGGDSGAIYLWDEASQLLTPHSWEGVGTWMADVRIRSGEGVAGTAAARREGILVNDYRTSPYATPFWLEHLSNVAVLAEPLLYRERLVGVITVNRNDPTRPFLTEHQRLLALFAAPAAIAIENARLFATEQAARMSVEESEARFREIADNVREVFWIEDIAQHSVLYATRAYEEIWGRPRAALHANSAALLEGTHPDDLERLQAARAEVSRGNATVLEYRIIRPNGALRWIRTHAAPIPSRDGTAERIVGVAEDITAYKHAEEALRESERRFRELLERIQLAAVMIDLRGIVTFCNDFLLTLTGYARAEIVGKDYFERFLPPDIAGIRRTARIDAAHAGTLAPTIEADLWTAGGERLLIRWNNTLLYDASGMVLGSASIGEDVTAIRRAEAARRASEEALRAVIQASPLAIVALDGQGLVRVWNPAAERMFGWSGAELLGKPPPVLPPDVNAEMAAHIQEVMGGRQITNHETVRPRKDGSMIPVSYSVGPIRDAQGAVVGVVGLLADLTSRKQLEAQLRQAQKMQALGRLAGGVAHDFNNHLLIITGFVELLMMQLRDARPETLDALTEIRGAGERAADLVRQLLAFSRKQVLEPTVLDLNAILAETHKMLARLLGEDIAITLELQPDLGNIFADRSQIEQVILNLAVNARDAMPHGGTLTLRTASMPLPPTVPGQATRPISGPSVVLTVTDTGLGMDEKIQTQIFEPFFTTKEHGTGLGLATVYGIVEQSGGAVWVESAPGAGTTFGLCFPQTHLPMRASRAKAPRAHTARGSETVLLVEDMASARRLMSQTLRIYGYTVLEAPDGEHALTVARDHAGAIDLLLTDVVMPRMTGPELAATLRVSRPTIRVLYVSGYTREAFSHRSMSGTDPIVLQKPFTPEDLAHHIRRVLNES